MSRLAWFSPVPPTKSGIAQYSCELVPRLTDAHEIDLFVEAELNPFVSSAARVRVFNAYEFLSRNHKRPYDLIIYQLGNAPCHDYMWAYLVRFPGMVVLHDGQLHHARARMLLQ